MIIALSDHIFILFDSDRQYKTQAEDASNHSIIGYRCPKAAAVKSHPCTKRGNQGVNMRLQVEKSH
jgi:hypothetical protein